MENFDDLTILLIRQCKKNKPSMRSMRRIVGMKCALSLSHVTKFDVVYFLIRIVIDYNLVRDWNEFFITDLNPKKDYFFISEENRPPEKSYIDNLIDALISKVSCTEVKIFPYYRSPLRFRK